MLKLIIAFGLGYFTGILAMALAKSGYENVVKVEKPKTECIDVTLYLDGKELKELKNVKEREF